MNYQQIDLFSDDYKTLTNLLDIVCDLNPTGGYYPNWKPIPPDYVIDFYKDLAFIVMYRGGEDSSTKEKIIDNAIYLERCGEDLYKIYDIDGAVFGRLSNTNEKHVELAQALIAYMTKGVVFKDDTKRTT